MTDSPNMRGTRGLDEHLEKAGIELSPETRARLLDSSSNAEPTVPKTAGRLLHQAGLVDASDLLQLIELQEAEPGRSLLELAIAQGYCSAEQLADARTQAASGPRRLAEHLINEVGLDPAQLCAALLAYIDAAE